MPSPRLAILASHPVQYYAPLFRELARRIELRVYYAHNATPEQQAAAGFGQGFAWDIDLTSGYSHRFLRNVSRNPGTDHFFGCDTPDIARVLSEARPDVVMALGWHLKSMLQGIIAGKRLNLPVIVRGDSQLGTPRSNLKKTIKAVIYPPLLRVFDAALYVGERNRQYLRYYHYPTQRLFHSPHCIDTARFAASATPEERRGLRAQLGITGAEKIVLFVGKLIPVKRPVDVVEAVACIRRSGMAAHVLVVGAGPLEADLRARAETLGVPHHMLGFQNQSRLPAAYAAADVLCLPSVSETWGLVCNEALACGTPIVVSDAVGCAPDLVAGGGVGLSFPMGDIGALSNALARVLKEPPTALSIRAMSDRHSLAAAADGVSAALERVMYTL